MPRNQSESRVSCPEAHAYANSLDHYLAQDSFARGLNSGPANDVALAFVRIPGPIWDTIRALDMDKRAAFIRKTYAP